MAQVTKFNAGDLVIHFEIVANEVKQSVLMIEEVLTYSGRVRVLTNNNCRFDAKGLAIKTNCQTCEHPISFIVRMKDIVKNEIF